MARAAKKARNAKPASTNAKSAQAHVPDVYRDMLADVTSSSPTQVSEGGRVVKRRRVGGRVITQCNENDTESLGSNPDGVPTNDSDMDELFEDVKPSRRHIVKSDSEDSAGSDLNWEEVELDGNLERETTDKDDDTEDGEIAIVLEDRSTSQKSLHPEKTKRKPMTTEDKMLRLAVHKMHICSLLAHLHLRSHWCNDEEVYASMRKLLPQKTISYLNPNEDMSQFQRSRSFMDGLTQASEAFRSSFKITARGIGKSKWADSQETLALLQPPGDVEFPMRKSDFRDAAQNMEASRDTGAQLFCAMLRAAGADARLVCSLQPLPFQPSQPVSMDSVRPRTNKSSNDPAITSKKRTKAIRESKFPIYWVEAFNEAVQKWVPLDPIVTKSIAKQAKFEPPAGEPENQMTYVIAFEDDGSARDVTRRYVKAYNGKTRRHRVEVMSGGERWWRRVMKMFRRSYPLDRDQLEDAELSAKEAQEPMPRNVQDFKGHPYYALERHMKRHEVIHPKREVGKVSAGRSNDALETIYRRRDVHSVKSAEKWYRLGREIKTGEQPLKRVPARRRRDQSLDPEDLHTADEDNAGTALYAAYQTSRYTAPPVRNGRIPKNVYGNLDVYVPSMVPPGGVHISHPDVAKAARILGVDYADAVTGFSFKGRHGTAVTNGAVVAQENREAVIEVIQAFEDDRARAEEEKRSREALRMWKRLLAGLRIRKRIEGYDIEGERDDVIKDEMGSVEDENDEDDEGGGFLPDRDAEEEAQPTAGRMPIRETTHYDEGGGGGFLANDYDDNEHSQQRFGSSRLTSPLNNDFEGDGGGGFLVDNDEDIDAEEAIADIQRTESDGEKHGIADKKISDESGGFILPENISTPSQQPTIEKSSNIDSALVESSATDPSIRISTLKGIYDHPPTTTEAHQATTNETPIPSPDIKPSSRATSSDAESYRGDPYADLEEIRDLEEARLLHEDERNKKQQAGSVPTQGRRVENPFPDAFDAPPVYDHDGGEGGEEEEEGEAAMKAESSEEDKGSLLSHDPEDEDAEPEWLA